MHIGVVLNSNPSSVRWSILTCSSRSSISNCLLISIYSENLFTIVVRVFIYINWLLRDVISNTTDSGSVKTSCIMKNRSGITSALLNNCTSLSCNSNNCPSITEAAGRVAPPKVATLVVRLTLTIPVEYKESDVPQRDMFPYL